LALREDGPKALQMLAGSIPVWLVAAVIESTLSMFQSVGPVPKSICGFMALAGCSPGSCWGDEARNRRVTR
ncbi:MAG TPA: hypothetical protein VFC86_06200, partial [Planctomycetota bacterium]|nr:hypothetical protein [Planctomycetota bacterium]